MTGLIELKEKLKNFYAEHEVVMRPIVKFLAVLVSLMVIKSNIGYMNIINMWPVIIIISVVSAFLTWGMLVLVLAADIAVNIFSMSLELGALVFIVMLIMFLFFFRFTPKQGALLVLIPLAYFLKIPFVVPIAVELICSPVSIVSVAFGTVLYYMIDVISNNATVITNSSDGTIGSASINAIINMMSNNKAMMLAVIASAITIMVVYIIRRATINNAFSEGGEGAVDMARLVVDTIENNPSESLRYTYKEEDSIQQKIEKVATNIYGASVITYSSIARNRIKLIEKMGITHYPVCIAKTQYSFSADPKIYGAVNNFEFHIKDIVINNGAEMIVAIAGEILRMPGLPKEPQALHIDIVDGEIEGLS